MVRKHSKTECFVAFLVLSGSQTVYIMHPNHCWHVPAHGQVAVSFAVDANPQELLGVTAAKTRAIRPPDSWWLCCSRRCECDREEEAGQTLLSGRNTIVKNPTEDFGQSPFGT